MGVMKVTMDSGLLSEEYFLGNKEVSSFKTKSAIRTHLTSVTREPLVIPMVLFFDKNLDWDKEREIKDWLDIDEYCELRFENDQFVYYATLHSKPKLTHNSIDSGYIEFEFLTNSPYRFSEVITTSNEGTNLSTMGEYTTVPIMNDGDLICKPTIEIVAPNQVTDLEIRNEDTGQTFLLNGTFTNLSLTILCEKEELHSEAPFPTLYDAHNGTFIYLQKGRNTLRMKGQFYYKITYQFVYK